MPWMYQQATGHLLLNTVFVGGGYSGHGTGLNNPAAQDEQNVGPLPVGRYTVGEPHNPPDHLGPLALPLYPDPSNSMFGRFGFFMHGDNQYGNKTASDGCVVMSPDLRAQVASSLDKALVVVSGILSQSVDTGQLLSTLLSRDSTSALIGSSPTNAYTDLPELPFQRTSVAMDDVVKAFNASAALADVKRASYVIFRNESGNGAKGINNNYVGAQADSGRWPDSLTSRFAGTVTINENGTGRLRVFLAFKSVAGNLDFLMDRVMSKGLYIGGQTHQILKMSVGNEGDLARAYHKEWVTGSASSEPSADETASFLSMYRQGTQLIA